MRQKAGIGYQSFNEVRNVPTENTKREITSADSFEGVKTAVNQVILNVYADCRKS